MSSTPAIQTNLTSPLVAPQRPAAPFAPPAAPQETTPAEPEDGYRGSIQAEPPPARKEPISADMAQMLEDIERARDADAQALALAKQGPLAHDLAGREVSAATVPGGSSSAPTALVAFDEHPPHDADHAHHHHHEQKQHALTSAYLGATGAKAQLISHGHEAAGAVGGHAAEAAHNATALATAKAEAAHAVATAKTEAGRAAIETAGELGTLATAVAVGGVVGSVIAGVGVTILGAKQLHDGIKHKNTEEVMEGSGGLVLGAKSGLTALTLGGKLAGEGVLSTAAHAVHGLLTPLGVAHGAIDTVIGGKQIYDGVKAHDKSKVVKGLLNVGMGVSLGAAAVTGGLPALVVAGGFLGAKVLHTHLAARKAKKEAAAITQQQQLQQQAPQPPAGGPQPPVAETKNPQRTS